jgi:hypothetical protein
MWVIGEGPNWTSDSLHPNAFPSMRAPQDTVLKVWTQPFGREVVPLL